jgi:hypothetical protein
MNAVVKNSNGLIYIFNLTWINILHYAFTLRPLLQCNVLFSSIEKLTKWKSIHMRDRLFNTMYGISLGLPIFLLHSIAAGGNHKIIDFLVELK